MFENENCDSTNRVESVSVSEPRVDTHDESKAPNPEVTPNTKRKYLTAGYKLKILSETDREPLKTFGRHCVDGMSICDQKLILCKILMPLDMG